MLGKPRRLAVLAEGSFAPLDAKTAIGVLRYRPAEVAAVIDSTRAGRTAAACVGVGGTTPVVAGLDEAAALGADALLIGIAPQGGQLPAAWRDTVCGALERGWDVLSGLHVFLGDDPELARRAEAGGARSPRRSNSASSRSSKGMPPIPMDGCSRSVPGRRLLREP